MNALRTTTWSLPSSLKNAQLQRIATSIGAPLTGTKPQLIKGINELVAEIEALFNLSGSNRKQTPNVSPTQPWRILSIDMGIKNLAFAFLTCQRTTSRSHNLKDKGETNSLRQLLTIPQLRQWRRTELFDIQSETSLDLNSSNSRSKSRIQAGLDTTTTTINTTSSTTSQLNPIDNSFEPSNLARHAYFFAKYCASLNPTHILIERQRFRTAGNAAVQEWSLRVGMLEAMLHANFQTLKCERVLDGETVVQSVLPMRVNKFWFADGDADASGAGGNGDSGGDDGIDGTVDATSKTVKKAKVKVKAGAGSDAGDSKSKTSSSASSRSKLVKFAKINIVDDMLGRAFAATEGSVVEGSRDPPQFSIHADVKPMVDAFRTRAAATNGNGNKKKGGKSKGAMKSPRAKKADIDTGSNEDSITISLDKLDDMSDALLQGLAWLRWQENRTKLLMNGTLDV